MKKNYISNKKISENSNLLHILDRGIDDMEAGHELPLEDAFHKITELRDTHRNKRIGIDTSKLIQLPKTRCS